MRLEKLSDDSLELDGLTDFSAEKIFDCGQCFRFDPVESADGFTIEGVARGKLLRLTELDGRVRLDGVKREDFDSLWSGFLALDCDYPAIRGEIIGDFDRVLGYEDPVIRKASECGRGIRILRQEPWEALISFIISQNNNIPRIKKLIAALCETYGEKFETKYGERHSFPTPKSLLEAGVDGIFALKTGFRAKYIYDAAEAVESGRIDLESLRRTSAQEALDKLMTIKGVGPKVASCVSLFGLGHTEAFPVDVWIRRVLETRYPAPHTLDYAKLGRYAGIAQQYLFYYERSKPPAF